MKDADEFISPDTIKYVVGSKIDRSDLRTVTPDEGQAFAKQFDALFIEISALSGENINELFHSLSQEVYQSQIDKNLTKC